MSRGSKNMRWRFLAPAVGFAMLSAAPLHAAEWKHEVAPYLWGAAISGTTAIGPLEIDVDASFSDIGGRDFQYDMSMSGPALGVVFTV